MGGASHPFNRDVNDIAQASIAEFGDASIIVGKNVVNMRLGKITKLLCSLYILGISSLGAAENFESQACLWPGPDSLAAVIPVAAADGSRASGVVVGQNRILTAAHAVAPDTEVFVGIDAQFHTAHVLLRDVANDLLILVADTANISPLPISLAEPRLLEPVWAVGFPRAQAKTTSMGVLQRKIHGALHASAPIDSGQSGGGLLLCHEGAYTLAGMLRGYGAYLEGGEYVRLKNHSVSVAAATIQQFVDTQILYP